MWTGRGVDVGGGGLAPTRVCPRPSLVDGRSVDEFRVPQVYCPTRLDIFLRRVHSTGPDGGTLHSASVTVEFFVGRDSPSLLGFKSMCQEDDGPPGSKTFG